MVDDIRSEALKGEAESLLNRVKAINQSGDYPKNVRRDLKTLSEDYQSFSQTFSQFNEDYGVDGILLEEYDLSQVSLSSRKKIKTHAKRFGTQLRKAIAALQASEKVSLDEEDERKLDEIEKDINDLRPAMPVIGEDLEESLEEVYSGHFLAAAMISGRIIDYIISEIQTEENLADAEEAVDHLKSNIIGTADGQITEALKLYRNIYAHEIGKSPDFKNCSIMLFGTIDLLQSLEEQSLVEKYNLT